MARRSGFGRRSAFGAVSSNMLMIGGIGIAIIGLVIFLTMSSAPKKPSVPLDVDEPDVDEPDVVAPRTAPQITPLVGSPVVAKQVAPPPILSSPGIMVDAKKGASVMVDTKKSGAPPPPPPQPASKIQNLKQKLSKF
jgi:hypothetical protein